VLAKTRFMLVAVGGRVSQLDVASVPRQMITSVARARKIGELILMVVRRLIVPKIRVKTSPVFFDSLILYVGHNAQSPTAMQEHNQLERRMI
jgi:hypothetical protein